MEKSENTNWKMQEAVWRDDTLGMSKLVILLALLRRRNAKIGACYPSRETLDRDTRLSTRQVRRIVSSLEKRDYLALRKGKSFSYSFPKWTQCPPQADTMSSKPIKETTSEEKGKDEEKDKENTWEEMLKDPKRGGYFAAALRAYGEPVLWGGLFTENSKPVLDHSAWNKALYESAVAESLEAWGETLAA